MSFKIGSSKSKNPISVRYTDVNLEAISRYQRDRRIDNQSLALNQIVRMGTTWHEYMVSGGGKPQDRWITPEQDIIYHTVIEELNPEQLESVLRRLTQLHVSEEQLEWLRDLAKKQRSTAEKKEG